MACLELWYYTLPICTTWSTDDNTKQDTLPHPLTSASIQARPLALLLGELSPFFPSLGALRTMGMQLLSPYTDP